MYRVELPSARYATCGASTTSADADCLTLSRTISPPEPQPANLDIKALAGRAPWLRLRRGEYRVPYRPLTASELRALAASEQAGFLVERVV
jgi:hypothetical protein